MYIWHVKEDDLFNPKTETFIHIKEQYIQLEHSLKSVYEWESKWKKPFLSKDEKSLEETIDYIRCMTITPKVNELVYNILTQDKITEIYSYINDPMTATTFTKLNKPHSREIITAEIIYYDMIQMQIPFECEKWHLNKLLTLIEVCSRKNAPAKKMSQKEIMARNRSLNKARRAKTGSRG